MLSLYPEVLLSQHAQLLPTLYTEVLLSLFPEILLSLHAELLPSL